MHGIPVPKRPEEWFFVWPVKPTIEVKPPKPPVDSIDSRLRFAKDFRKRCQTGYFYDNISSLVKELADMVAQILEDPNRGSVGGLRYQTRRMKQTQNFAVELLLGMESMLP